MPARAEPTEISRRRSSRSRPSEHDARPDGCRALLRRPTLACSCALYAWQACGARRPRSSATRSSSPSSRARSPTPARRRFAAANPRPDVSLYAYLAAPAWWLTTWAPLTRRSSSSASLLMTAAIFPAYLLARLVVSRPYALFAAVGVGYRPGALVLAVPRRRAARVPHLDSRSPPDRARRDPAVDEVGRALSRSPSAWYLVFVRTQLAGDPVPGARARSARPGLADRGRRRWRATWSAWDWAGSAVLPWGLRSASPHARTALVNLVPGDRVLEVTHARSGLRTPVEHP